MLLVNVARHGPVNLKRPKLMRFVQRTFHTQNALFHSNLGILLYVCLCSSVIDHEHAHFFRWYVTFFCNAWFGKRSSFTVLYKSLRNSVLRNFRLILRSPNILHTANDKKNVTRSHHKMQSRINHTQSGWSYLRGPKITFSFATPRFTGLYRSMLVRCLNVHASPSTLL